MQHEECKSIPLAFQGKYVLTGQLLLITGLRIGGREPEYEIGGEENPVVKDPITGEPYIPGSSLKGKLRSLLEWAYQGRWNLIRLRRRRQEWESYVEDMIDDSMSELSIIFGAWDVNNKAKVPVGPTRVTFRDAFLSEAAKRTLEHHMGEGVWTEIKSENAIDRVLSRANPRTMERIPAGAFFDVEILFDIYQPEDHQRLRYLFEGMRLLEDNALGSGGSRGSGRVRFRDLRLEWRSREYYTEGARPKLLREKANVEDLLRDFEELVGSVQA